MNSDTSITAEELLAHSAWLRRLAQRLVDPATADDLVQETWAAAVRAQPEKDRPLRPWLAEVLRNLARTRARGQRRWAARAGKVAAGEDAPLPTPEELLTFHEAQRLVAEAVAGLDEPYRSTVLLCYAQGLEPAEIARRQGVPGGTVRWRLKRGIDDLRARLDARYGDRRAWCTLLAPLAAHGGAMVVGRGATVKFVVALAAVATLGVGTLWTVTRRAQEPSAAPVARVETAPAAATRPSLPKLAAAPPGTGTGPQPPGRPNPALAAAAAPAPEPDRAEALKRAAEPGDSPAQGPANAPVTIVTYTEFECPFCARVQPTLKQLMEAYPQQIRFVFKHLPLPFHPGAQIAAEASLAAHEQGKFWEMHDRLFANQERLDPASLEEHAKAIGLDVVRFKAALDSGKHRKRVEADMALAKAANIMGTPTFLINGEMMSGAQPLDAFKTRMDVELAKAKGLPPPEKKPAAPRPAGPQNARRPDGMRRNPWWPPPKIALPDAVLGDRLPVRFVTSNAPMLGNPKARIEVLHFVNLTMPGDTHHLVHALLETYAEHVKVFAKFLPTSRSDEGYLAAEASHAAHAQGKFWEFRDSLDFLGTSSIDRSKLEKAGEKAGLDLDQFRAALDEGRFRATVRDEDELFQAARLAGSGVAVNGRMAEGAVALVQLVDAAIRKTGGKPPTLPKPTVEIEINPRAPTYDSNRLLAFLTPRQLFQYEPRDDAWAPAVEKELSPLILRDLKIIEPKLGGASLECRTTWCRLRWKQGDPRLLLQATNYLYTTPGRPYGTEVYLFLRPATSKTAGDTVAKVRARRSTVLYNVRTGRGAGLPANIPFDRLKE